MPIRAIALARFVALLLALAASAGCMRDHARLVDGGNWTRLKPKLPDATPDIVELHYIFLERPLGDPLLNTDIWAEADEQAIPLDQKALLEENGIRMARLGANLSTKMLALLRENPSTGRRHQAHSGSLAKIQTTEIIPRLEIFTLVAGQTRGESIEQAQGYFYLTPTIGTGARIRLTVVPEVEHGEQKNRRTPAPDLSGWILRSERDARGYDELKADLDLTSGEYLLLGCYPERNGTLGHRFLTSGEGTSQRQTVVLVRAIRPSREELVSAGIDVDDFFLPELLRKYLPTRGVARELAAPTQ